MISLGLTGGYATGKSTVAEILRSLVMMVECREDSIDLMGTKAPERQYLSYHLWF